MTTLQTLERGLATLDLVARSPGLSVAQLAAALGVHRAIAYRLARTLQAQGYLRGEASEGLRLGAAIPRLWDAFVASLPPDAQSVLDELSRRTRATSALVTREGDECVALRVAARNEGPLQVAYRAGARHAVTQGAAGLALCCLDPPRSGELDAVTRARAQGYAMTRGVLQTGATGVFAPLPALRMAIGIVAMRDVEVADVLPALREAADRLTPG